MEISSIEQIEKWCGPSDFAALQKTIDQGLKIIIKPVRLKGWNVWHLGFFVGRNRFMLRWIGPDWSRVLSFGSSAARLIPNCEFKPGG